MKTRLKVHKLPGNGPTYLSNDIFAPPSKTQPFPKNPEFTSEPVLSEAAREKIWVSVMEQGLPLKAVSARYGVDMRRVAAVVRLKEMERQWVAGVSNVPLSAYLAPSHPLSFV